MARNIVLGLGNILNRDEGLGVHALKLLGTRLAQHEPIELIDGGTLGLSLLQLVEACEHLLLLDAVNAGLAPGTIMELRGEDIPLYTGLKMSQHQVTFQEVLGLARIRGRLPSNLHMIGVQPADLSVGVGLSPVVEAAMPEVVERAVSVVQAWGLMGEE
jgi:hydrogenase maturation protease